MAITKKTAAGGIAALGSTAGVGYGIHAATKDNRNKELMDKLSLVNDRFKFDGNKEECGNALSVSEISEINYRKAIKSCSEAKTLAGIARRLGLDVLSSKNKGNSGLFWGDINKEEIKTIVTETAANDKGEGNKGIMNSRNNQKVDSIEPVAETIVIKGCEDENNKKFDENTKVEKGHNFLIACTKDPKVMVATFKKPNIPLTNFVGSDEAKGHLKTTENTIGNVFLGTAKTEERNKHLEQDFGTNDTRMEGKIRSAGFKFKDTKEQSCKDALNKEFDNYGEKYKAAVKACAKSDDFKKRAKELGFNVVPESVQEDDGKGLGEFSKTGTRIEKYKLGEALESVRDKIKERIKSAIGDTFTSSDSGTTDQPKIKAHCENASNNKQISGEFTDANGQKYLKACTKNKSISKQISETEEKAINFGTGKYTEAPASN